VRLVVAAGACAAVGQPAEARSAHETEEGPHLVHEQCRLLEGGEVPAPVELVPVADVGVAALGPAA
jgi:coenzyme F420-reducing hydrogenase gamma subunit